MLSAITNAVIALRLNFDISHSLPTGPCLPMIRRPQIDPFGLVCQDVAPANALPLVELGEARYFLERMQDDQRMVLFNDKRVKALDIRPAT